MKRVMFAVMIIAGSASLVAESDFQAAQAKITASTLNVRNIASSGGIVIGSLKRGDVVDAIERSPNEATIDGVSDFWYKVKFFNDKRKEHSGWVFGGYVSFELNLESGLRWKSIQPGGTGTNFTSIAVAENGDILGGSSTGVLYISNDKAKSWRQVSPQALGVTIGSINKIVTVGKTIYIASKGKTQGGLWRSANNGSSWAQYTTSQGLLSNDIEDFVVAPNGTIFAVSKPGISASKDNGTSWKTLSDDGLKGEPTRLAASKSGQVICGTTKGLFALKQVKDLFGKDDIEWERIGEKSPNMGVVLTIAVSSNDDLWIGTSKGINKSSMSNLKKWVGIGGQSIVNDIMIESSGRILIATDNGFNISLDQGASWATYKKENGLLSNASKCVAVSGKDRTIWLVTGSSGISYHE